MALYWLFLYLCLTIGLHPCRLVCRKQPTHRKKTHTPRTPVTPLPSPPMAWILLIIASLFEVGWPLGFKLSERYPDHFWTFITLASISMALSGVFLYFAQKSIPVSTAYIIWTGIGAVGTFLIGICFFGESASLLRMFFALLILVGIVGLELLT